MTKTNEAINAVDVLITKGTETYEWTKVFLECLEAALVAAGAVKGILEKCNGGNDGK